ncbi:MAG TPA: UDP-N-acetylmuramoyl-L-alanyl-D-glutamate--2,6-diaminopimelate ligase, partial [Nocardioides bacterium]|nr:UDP-N-acetylmuramoyl-L-alanyl-D-glutamate--2,6-diaminopimelate ligase [Nocardioides sp.]
RAGVIGTVGTRIAGEEVKTTLTTPEAPDLHALFAVMRERDVAACTMEVSSHALVKGRVDGVVFDVAVFLNLGRDHLDFHADVEDYYRAKASLFTSERARRALICVDDEHGRRLARETTLPVRTFSTIGTEADWTVADVDSGPDGTSFRVLGPGVDAPAGVPLPGAFNVTNALAAVAACGEAGLDAAAVARGIASGGGVPGRFERIDAGQPFTVVVDYAHKPDAVQAALDSLRPLTQGRLIVVLGAGGDRDPGKRP